MMETCILKRLESKIIFYFSKLFLIWWLIYRESHRQNRTNTNGEPKDFNRRNSEQIIKNMSYFIENKNELCHSLNKDSYDELAKNCPKNSIVILFILRENHEKIFSSIFKRLIEK